MKDEDARQDAFFKKCEELVSEVLKEIKDEEEADEETEPEPLTERELREIAEEDESDSLRDERGYRGRLGD
jgi:hypothetical protein